jgi:hypothetical protein
MTDEIGHPNVERRAYPEPPRVGGGQARTLRRAVVGFWLLVRETLRHLGPVLAAFWRAARPILRGILQMLLALIIVFEEWGWQPLADLLGRLAKWRPWAAVETAIARLPPYAALVVFALPSALLLPLKFLAVFLVAQGQIVMAGLLFLAAKVVATALIARLFLLTQPSLMQIGWFARGYDTVMPWKDALVEQVHESWVWRAARIWKERARRVVMRQWWQMRPTLRLWRRRLSVATRAARAQAQRLARAARQRIGAFLAR